VAGLRDQLARQHQYVARLTAEYDVKFHESPYRCPNGEPYDRCKHDNLKKSFDTRKKELAERLVPEARRNAAALARDVKGAEGSLSIAQDNQRRAKADVDEEVFRLKRDTAELEALNGDLRSRRVTIAAATDALAKKFKEVLGNGVIDDVRRRLNENLVDAGHVRFVLARSTNN